jgi:hypothetical protein
MLSVVAPIMLSYFTKTDEIKFCGKMEILPNGQLNVGLNVSSTISC